MRRFRRGLPSLNFYAAFTPLGVDQSSGTRYVPHFTLGTSGQACQSIRNGHHPAPTSQFRPMPAPIGVITPATRATTPNNLPASRR